MALEPVHFRGRCVPNRRDAVIGVRGRFRGKRQDRRSCGRRDGRNGDGRRRRSRGGGLLRGDRIPMTLEPAHFRGQRVHFALNRRDAAIGVRRRFRGERQDRRSCGRRRRAKMWAGRRAKRRRPAAATPGGWPALGRSNPDDFGAGPLPRLLRPFRAQPPRRGDRRPPPLPRQAAGPAKLRAAERAKRRRPAAATPGGWPALGRSNPDDFGAGPLPRPSRRFRAQPPRRGDRCPPPLPRQAAGRAKLRAAERAKRRRPAAATPGGWPALGRSNPDDFGAGPLPRLSRRFRAQPPRRGDRRPPPLPRQAAGPAKMRAGRRAKYAGGGAGETATAGGGDARGVAGSGEVKSR